MWGILLEKVSVAELQMTEMKVSAEQVHENAGVEWPVEEKVLSKSMKLAVLNDR